MHALKQYPKEIKIFQLTSLVSSLGGSLMWLLIPMYVFDELGHSMTDAGMVILVLSFSGIFRPMLLFFSLYMETVFLATAESTCIICLGENNRSAIKN
ncbi:hypothetical protein FHR92_003678 [Fontibacillus solani]|uniref:Uncharacterized protein n=1 Tax=Fontibacillus solani TaxID=1572857 RepID=A0A7W3SVT9_9BACL|nr:hypothetical protein [Fontibacillus solani]MBA9087196.1 hypothetical protein [Fontibacillus solani]